MRFDREIFDAARREFLSHLLYAKGHGQSTCYAYNGDLGLWANWLTEAGKDWQRARPTDVEQFAAWQLRERKISAHITNRRLSTLSTFYKGAARPRVHRHDADLYQRWAGTDGKGGGEVVSHPAAYPPPCYAFHKSMYEIYYMNRQQMIGKFRLLIEEKFDLNNSIVLKNDFCLACYFSLIDEKEASQKILKNVFDLIGWERNKTYFIAIQESLDEYARSYAKEIHANSEIVKLVEKVGFA